MVIQHRAFLRPYRIKAYSIGDLKVTYLRILREVRRSRQAACVALRGMSLATVPPGEEEDDDARSHLRGSVLGRGGEVVSFSAEEYWEGLERCR